MKKKNNDNKVIYNNICYQYTKKSKNILKNAKKIKKTK